MEGGLLRLGSSRLEFRREGAYPKEPFCEQGWAKKKKRMQPERDEQKILRLGRGRRLVLLSIGEISLEIVVRFVFLRAFRVVDAGPSTFGISHGEVAENFPPGPIPHGEEAENFPLGPRDLIILLIFFSSRILPSLCCRPNFKEYFGDSK